MNIKKGSIILLDSWRGIISREIGGVFENYVGEKFATIGFRLYKISDLTKRIYKEIPEIKIEWHDNKNI